MMLRTILAIAAGTLTFQVAHATRPGYADVMWMLRVATVCWAQNAGYREAPLAAALGRPSGEWGEFDQQESIACLKRLQRMPDSVCSAVTGLDEATFSDTGRMKALRAEHEVEAWRAEQALGYLERAGPAGRHDVACPDAVAAPSPADIPPLDEHAAACVQAAPAVDVDNRHLLRMDIASLTKLADAGNPHAQNTLARNFGLGLSVSKDPVASASWYRRAAEQGLAVAQANLAYMYLNGEGVPRDTVLALDWAKKSAAQGSAMGQLTVAYMYGTGAGVPRNGRQAERCYLLAAKQGSSHAQETLARMYGRGDGVPVDKDLSLLWFKRSRQEIRTGKPWTEQAQ